MDEETGNLDFPLWLIADTSPVHWESHVTGPLDPRHPLRHSLWTSVLDATQDKLYRESGLRLDTTNIYVRNAVPDARRKPDHTAAEWSPYLEAAVEDLRLRIEAHRPILLCCFGAFAFEFVRRALREGVLYPYAYWTARRKGQEFRDRIEHFEPGEANALPLLHAVIARGKFLRAHEDFCGRKDANYFEVVGLALAETLLRFRNQLPMWIESRESVAI